MVDTAEGGGRRVTIPASALPEPASNPWPRPLAPPISAIAYPHSLHLLCSIVPGAATGGQVADRRGRLDSDVLESSLDREVIASRLNVLVAEACPVKSRWITGG
jgi:hypothetical protein